MNENKIPFSVLDLVPIRTGGSVKEAIDQSVALAQHVEAKEYKRFWIAEHHGMPGIASSATSVVMSYIASATKRIRVGAGGIMLPNHAPLVIAEQFGTLASMHPNRIDLGLGRAPGTDPNTMRALRRNVRETPDDFPILLEELRNYFKTSADAQGSIRAIPGAGMDIPIWILGSSDFGAILAGRLGLPFGFAAHFSPQNTLPALHLYRQNFVPSAILDKPYALVCVSVFAADTSEQAEFVATSSYQQFLSLIRGNPGQLPAPVRRMDDLWQPYEKAAVLNQLASTIIGDETQVHQKLSKFIADTQVDELMVISNAYHFEDRLKSYDIVAKHPLRKEN